MAKIQFLTILLVVTCFLDGVVSVTGKKCEVCNVFNPTLPSNFPHMIFVYFISSFKFQDRLNQMDQLLLQIKEENKVCVNAVLICNQNSLLIHHYVMFIKTHN